MNSSRKRNLLVMEKARCRACTERNIPVYANSWKGLSPASRARFIVPDAILGFRFAPPQALCCSALRALRWRHKPARMIVIFRDEERGSRVSAAVSRNLSRNSWDLRDLTETPVGMWTNLRPERLGSKA
jgi:hypothetical protein